MYTEEKEIIESVFGKTLQEQAELDIQLHREAIAQKRFTKKWRQLLLDDIVVKEKFIDIVVGNITDLRQINDVLLSLKFDQQCHKRYLCKRQSCNTGSYEWHKTWIEVYDGWIEHLEKIRKQRKVKDVS